LPSNQSTLDRVLALKNFLDAIRRGLIFSQEPEGHGSVKVLVRNLGAQLTLLEAHVRDEMALESAREHFKQLKAAINQILDQSISYLFSAVAEQSRTHLSLSLLSAPSEVVDEKLQASLQTREGALLKNLIQHPDMMRALFPQRAVALTFGKPVGLLGEASGTPFMDEKGKINPQWLDFLQKIPEQAAQLDPALRALPSGVSVVVLADAKATDEAQTPALANFVRLHGLVLTLATFQNYVESCWQLAGLGGDQLLYERLSEAITTLLTELLNFNRALQTTLAEFQGQLDALDAEAFKQKKDNGWQKNYEQAKACQVVLLKMLGECEVTLTQIIRHAKDSGARSQRLQAGLAALQRLQGAQDFLNAARRQVGAEPLGDYPGLITSSSPGSPVSTLKTIEALLLVLIPQAPQRVIALAQLCSETPQVLPWSIFRGTYQRVAYLRRRERLLSLGERIAHLEQYPGYAASSEGRAVIEQLQSHCQAELTRIARLSANLYWPFHRSSLGFFASWQTVFQDNQRRLQALARRYPEPTAAMENREGLSPESTPQTVSAPMEATRVSSLVQARHDALARAETTLERSEALLAETLRQKEACLRDDAAFKERFKPKSLAEQKRMSQLPRALWVSTELEDALEEEPEEGSEAEETSFGEPVDVKSWR